MNRNLGRHRTVLLATFAAVGLAGVALARVTHRFPYVSWTRQWSIGIYEGPSPFDLASAPGAVNPVLSARDVTDVPARFVADPFMIRRGNRWTMFFEVLNSLTRQGEIACASSADGLVWTYGQVVLREPFHLSYPYVFADGEAVYMIPESIAARSVRLYRAREFPRGWELQATLVEEPYGDPSIVRWAGRWWLFAAPWGDASLCVFHAERLAGPWIAHPGNPVVRYSPHGARPGGRVLVDGDRLYRFAQDDAPVYGLQLFAFEITELTTTGYAERLVRGAPVLKPGDERWRSRGMHTADPHQIAPGRWLACVDGSRRGLVWELRSWD